MSDLEEYVVPIGGLDHTMQLNKVDAERYGAVPVKKSERVDTAKAAGAQNKARTASDK